MTRQFVIIVDNKVLVPLLFTPVHCHDKPTESDNVSPLIIPRPLTYVRLRLHSKGQCNPLEDYNGFQK